MVFKEDRFRTSETITGLTQNRLYSLSPRERVRVRGLKIKDFFLFDPLTPALSRGEREQNA
jgi:hypothetical protein